MARKTERSRFRVLEFTCNSCRKTFADHEIEESLHFHDTAGYHNETVGDGTLWSIDLCQHCVKEILGPYIQKHDNHISRAFWSEQGIDAPSASSPVFSHTDGSMAELGEEAAYELGARMQREGLDKA